MLVLKREDDVKADYFLFLLSLFGDSKFKWNFLLKLHLIPKAVKAELRKRSEGRLFFLSIVTFR